MAASEGMRERSERANREEKEITSTLHTHSPEPLRPRSGHDLHCHCPLHEVDTRRHRMGGRQQPVPRAAADVPSPPVEGISTPSRVAGLPSHLHRFIGKDTLRSTPVSVCPLCPAALPCISHTRPHTRPRTTSQSTTPSNAPPPHAHSPAPPNRSRLWHKRHKGTTKARRHQRHQLWSSPRSCAGTLTRRGTTRWWRVK